MKSKLIIFLFVVIASFVLMNTQADWKNSIFIWDKSGYHLHLPATFIYKDLKHLSFYSYIDETYQPSGPVWHDYCIYQLENGNRINRYNIGLAVMEAPFFLIAHFINTHWLHYPPDGYSLPYQIGAVISTLMWVVIGLIALRRFLRSYFSDGVTAITLLLVGFGTNLWAYTVFAPAMTHSYCFALFSLLMLFTDKLYRTEHKRYFALLGFIMGLIAITRSSDMLVVLIPLLWGVHNKTTLLSRVQFAQRRLGWIAVALVCFMAIAMLQLGYWKYITGHWVYNNYPNEGFVWLQPELIEGLLGFRKGWFIYTPLAVVALCGIYTMRGSLRAYMPVVALFMLLNIYIVFCWWNWWYGGGFSARALIESWAILAMPLAALVHCVATQANKTVKVATFSVLGIIVALNLFQCYQYSKNIIHWDKMTAKYYFKVFLKTKATEEDKQLLMSEEAAQRENSRRVQMVQGK